jgi:two-component system vancomycin resistance associated response regulator VraR
MNNVTRVMIVDDQAISRRFFELTLKDSERYEILFSVASAFAADVYLLKEEVDLILMDVLMNDGSNGLDAAVKIRKDHPDVKIVVVTSMPEYSWMERAREIGVNSFWYKESDKVDILDVLDRTMAGESVYPASAPPARLGNAVRESFTEREMDVLREIAAGKSNSEIANLLCVSENTVKTHVRTLLQKTGFANRTELAVHARVVGLALHPEN